jgi:putative ABC transport system permease protein
MRLKIAFRNTFRNKRRTTLNVFMIASGMASLVLFQGFSTRMLRSIRDGMIRSDLGHIQIAQKTLWDKTNESARDNLIPDYAKLVDHIRSVPTVVSATGRIDFFGLVGSRDRTTAARMLSLDPVIEQSRLKEVNIIYGKPFAAGAGQQILLGSGLASTIRAKVGDNINLLGYTYDGVINAFDMEVVGIFRSGFTEIDNVTAITTLQTAQRLLDTDSVEKVIIYLNETEATDSTLKQISDSLSKSSPTLRARSWFDLSTLYRSVASFYRVYDRVIQLIILSLVLIGILNTVGMSIFERTGEIGTMRALGETEKKVVGQFILEGAVLGVLGGIAGVISSIVVAHIVNALQIPLVMPGASAPVTIEIAMPIRNFVEAGGLTMITAVLAAAIPAMRATKLNIVDALRRNI